jgi:chitin disaccharide deacetylase
VTLLIINADDYGLTDATSRTILDCYTDGVLTSTTVLVPAPGFAGTVGMLSDHPDLGIGVHLALVGEDRPVLSAAEIPSLVDDQGRFPISWKRFARSASLGRIDTADVERELTAQIDAVTGHGLTLTHLDSHQHLHEWPTLWPVVQRLARHAGVRAVRTTRAPGVGPMAVLGRLTAWRAGRSGLVTTDRFAGFSDSGSLTEPALLAALDSIPDGLESVEIGCHPGAVDDPDRGRYEWGFHWSEEAAGLRSPTVRARITAAGHRLGTFADLP